LYETDATITALGCRHGDSEFVIGTSTGCVLFHQRESSVPYQRTEIFPEATVGFANLPRIRGRAAMLVIGAHGTVALVRHVSVLMVYASIGFPVRRLYLVEELSCVTVERSDGSFMTFHMFAPWPTAVGAAPPSRARLVWESTSLEVASGAAAVRFGRNSILFSLFDVRTIVKDEKTRKMILGLFEANANGTRSTDLGVAERRSERQSSGSFVLLGSALRPTVFHEGAQLNGMIVMRATPHVATSHLMAKAIVSCGSFGELETGEVLL
jgi:hypothetical protein